MEHSNTVWLENPGASCVYAHTMIYKRGKLDLENILCIVLVAKTMIVKTIFKAQTFRYNLLPLIYNHRGQISWKPKLGHF